MKKILVPIIIMVGIYAGWGPVRNFLDPPEDYAALHEEEVVLYTTSWCGYCDKTKEFLRERNISFFEYDIEKSRTGYLQYQDLGGGGVPLILIGRETITGFRPKSIIRALSPES